MAGGQIEPNRRISVLPTLHEQPTDQASWDRFAFANRASHNAINVAILAKGGPDLRDPVIYPLDPSDLGGWLERHALLHAQMDSAIGQQSADLSLLDPNDPSSVAEWTNLHEQEHYTAEALLGVTG